MNDRERKNKEETKKLKFLLISIEGSDIEFPYILFILTGFFKDKIANKIWYRIKLLVTFLYK